MGKSKLQFGLSLKVLNDRISHLKEIITNRKDGKSQPVIDEKADAFYTEEGEIEDLEKGVKVTAAVSPSLERAIRKTARAVSSLATEMADNAQAKLKEQFGEGSSSSTMDTSPVKTTSPSKAATDISHLVKRKRDSDSEAPAPTTAIKSPTVKKVKVAEVTTNGVSVNGVSNGDS